MEGNPRSSFSQPWRPRCQRFPSNATNHPKVSTFSQRVTPPPTTGSISNASTSDFNDSQEDSQGSSNFENLVGTCSYMCPETMAPKSFSTMLKMAKNKSTLLAPTGGDSSPTIDVSPTRVNINQAEKVDKAVVSPKPPTQAGANKESANRKETPATPKEPVTKKAKKHSSRSSKNASHERLSAPPLEVDFLKQAHLDFPKAPLEVCARVISSYVEVHQQEVEAVKQRCQDWVLDERKKWVTEEKVKLEDQLSEKEDQLENTKAALEEAQSKLKSAEELHLKAVEDRDTYQKKLSLMEAEVANVNTLRLQIEGLRGTETKALQKIADLEAENAKLKEGAPRNEDLETKLAQANANRDLAVAEAIKCYDEGFCEAISQIYLAYPSCSFDNEIISSHNEAEGDQIFHLDRETGEKTLVWRRSPDV